MTQRMRNIFWIDYRTYLESKMLCIESWVNSCHGILRLYNLKIFLPKIQSIQYIRVSESIDFVNIWSNLDRIHSRYRMLGLSTSKRKFHLIKLLFWKTVLAFNEDWSNDITNDGKAIQRNRTKTTITMTDWRSTKLQLKSAKHWYIWNPSLCRSWSMLKPSWHSQPKRRNGCISKCYCGIILM
jgi:hypothetical protein